MNQIFDEIERMLETRQANESPIVDHIKPETPERLVAEKNASIDDFSDMLSKLVSKVMKKMKVVFEVDEGARLTTDQLDELSHPFITYSLLDCRRSAEIKPRIRETSLRGLDGQKTGKQRAGEIWGQQFTYRVQFNIIAGTCKEANDVLSAFKNLIFSYTAYLKRSGVKDIRFLQRITDRKLDNYRQKCSVRSLQYEVEIEELYTRFDTDIEGIELRR